MEINSKKEQKKEYYTSYLALFVNFNNIKKYEKLKGYIKKARI